MSLRSPANLWSLRGSGQGTEGLVRWRHAGLPWPELDHSDLSVWQGRTHAPAPCLCEGLGGGDDRAGDSRWQVNMKSRSTWINAGRYMPLGQARAAWG